MLSVQAAELTGRFSMLGTTAQAEPGDIGYLDADNKTLNADQQSLRLMLEAMQSDAEWSLHVKTLRQHQTGYPFAGHHASELFRYRDLSNNWLEDTNTDSSTHIGYEIDRAAYKYRFDNMSLSLGRQPIDWGSGRFWQPLNIFGAFAPTDLDTDFKAGIDAVLFDYYPSAFSSLTAAYVFAAENNDAIDNSNALHYKRQIGDTSEMAVLAGSVNGNEVLGASFESDWRGLGWRVEASHYQLSTPDENSTFWITGIDYQFSDGTLLAAEWYNNSRGASTEAELASMQSDIWLEYGLQQQLGQHVLGLLLDRDITPLLHAGYTLLVSSLKDDSNQPGTSMLHQLNLVYSVSNESDLLVSLLYANGKGLNQLGDIQSEFGHTPASITVRLRFYF